MTIAQFVRRASLFVRIWAWFAVITVLLRRSSLPSVVLRLSPIGGSARAKIPPVRLGRAVWRSLSLLGYHPRCLTAALVVYRLLAEQGQLAELVVGLPRDPLDKTAHAWVEIGGVDVGPPPGRQGHEELARYGTARVDALRTPSS